MFTDNWLMMHNSFKYIVRLQFLLIALLLPLLHKGAPVIDVSTLDTLATEISIPPCETINSFGGKGFNNLRSITFNGIDYLPPYTFRGLPNLEEVIFNGDNLVIGGAQFFDMPRLRRVVFNGNNFLINGSTMVGRSPDFETFEINGVIAVTEMWDPVECPLFTDYSGDYDVLYCDNSKLMHPSDPDSVCKKRNYADTFRKQLAQITEIFEKCDSNPNMAGQFMFLHPLALEYAAAFDVDTTAYVVARNKARENEYFWTQIEVLQHSPEYASDTLDYTFRYALPSDSLLQVSRERFNLDSIAGNGDDISRIKNLTYWVHNNILHDGSSDNPSVRLTLPEIYDVCKIENRGVNCRMLAIALAEALMAEGIVARYLTCQSKKWDTDQDCHVICVAWSSSQNKWVWCDPTFAAFVYDENGLMLHPGEVRERIINNQYIAINEDANWNNKEEYNKEEYIDDYMAKNLYHISANLNNVPAPEGYPYNHNPVFVTLSPVIGTYKGSQFITTEPQKFWAAP